MPNALARLADDIYAKGLDTPSGNVFGRWAQGVAQRTMHPLEALASVAQESLNDPMGTALNWSNPMAGGLVGMFAGKGAKTADVAKLALAEKMKSVGGEAEQLSTKSLPYRQDSSSRLGITTPTSPVDATLSRIENQVAPGWINTFNKHGGIGAIDDSLDIPAKSQAFADMAEAEGFKVIGRGDKYVTLKKSFGKTADGYEKEAIVKARISDHSNINRSTHFGETDINIAPDDGYSRDTFDDALEKLRSVDVNDNLDTVFSRATDKTTSAPMSYDDLLSTAQKSVSDMMARNKR